MTYFISSTATGCTLGANTQAFTSSAATSVPGITTESPLKIVGDAFWAVSPTDMSVEGTYNFFIFIQVEGGSSYCDAAQIEIVCVESSATIIAPTFEILQVFQAGSPACFEFGEFTSSSTACPVDDLVLYATDQTSTSVYNLEPITTSGSVHRVCVTLYSQPATFYFKVKVTAKGGAEHWTTKLALQLSCPVGGTTITRDPAWNPD